MNKNGREIGEDKVRKLRDYDAGNREVFGFGLSVLLNVSSCKNISVSRHA